MKRVIKIGIFGLGYVGTVTGACLAKEGHRVIGVDVNKEKVDTVNRGESPIVEEGIGRLILSVVKAKRFSAVCSSKEAVLETDVAMICVGTPSNEAGSLNLEHVKAIAGEIGKALKNRRAFYTIVVRSTVLPGTTEYEIIPILEKMSGKKAHRDFGICVNPEFMREGDSIWDFYNPPKTIIGAGTERERLLLKELYGFLKAPFIVTDIKTAEVSKYADNAFHALKICFANEIAAVASRIGLDPSKVMEVFCQDKTANISARYLKPGFAFGGSCLPKDIRALIYKAKNEDVKIPLIESIIESNDIHIHTAFDRIKKAGKKKIGILGLSFKQGTDDLRESQMVRLVELLIGKGFELKIYDRNVSMARIIGANKAYIENEIPHISKLLCRSLKEVVNDSDVVVIGHGIREFKEVKKKLRKNQVVIDLTL